MFKSTPKKPTTVAFKSRPKGHAVTMPPKGTVRPKTTFAIGGGDDLAMLAQGVQGTGAIGKLSPSQAIGITGAARSGDPNAIGFLAGLGALAAGGDAGAAADVATTQTADAVHVSAEFVAKWFGQAQADQLYPMAHLGTR